MTPSSLLSDKGGLKKVFKPKKWTGISDASDAVFS